MPPCTPKMHPFWTLAFSAVAVSRESIAEPSSWFHKDGEREYWQKQLPTFHGHGLTRYEQHLLRTLARAGATISRYSVKIRNADVILKLESERANATQLSASMPRHKNAGMIGWLISLFV